MRNIDDGSRKMFRLTEIMSNYLTLLSPPKQLQKDIHNFFVERAKHEEQINNLENTVQKLQTKVDRVPKLLQTIEQLKDENLELKMKAKGLEDTLDSLSESQSVKNLNVTLQTQLKSQEDEISKIKEELERNLSLNQKLSNEINSVSELKVQISQLSNKLSGESKEKKQLRQILQNERKTIENLRAEVKGLDYAKRRLERRLTTKGGSYLRGLSIPIEHLEISEDLSSQADEDIRSQIKTMNFELQKRLDRIKELEIRNQDLKQRLAKSSDHDLQMEIQNLKSELESRKGSIMGLESTRKKLMEQIEAHQQRIAELQNKVMLQGKELEERNKNIKNLEVTVSSGVQDDQARTVIQNLQQQNRDFRNEVRESEKIIRSLEKNIKFLQTQLKTQKEESYKLYNQTKDQIILIQKLQTALSQGGHAADVDLKALKAATRSSSLLEEEGPSLDSEIKERDRKINRLETYVANFKQEVEDLQFRITSRDVKIDELTNIIKEIKRDIASSKGKIIVRPPSADEFQKTKVKL